MGVKNQRFNILILILSGVAVAYIAFPFVSIITFLEPSMVLKSLTRPQLGDAFILSLISSTISTLLLVFFGMPLAYCLARYYFSRQVSLKGYSYFPTSSSSPCKWCSPFRGIWSIINFRRYFFIYRIYTISNWNNNSTNICSFTIYDPSKSIYL